MYDVSGQLMNVSPIFTLLVVLHPSSPTLEGNISVCDSLKCVHLLCGAEQVLTVGLSEPCHQKQPNDCLLYLETSRTR